MWIVEKFPNAMQQRLVDAVIGSANGYGSIESREAAARGPIKFGIQVGICRERGLYDFAVESIDLAMGASGGRGPIMRTRAPSSHHIPAMACSHNEVALAAPPFPGKGGV